jgi:hypothetical protein
MCAQPAFADRDHPHGECAGNIDAAADLAAGQWDLIIELSRQDERLFRSKNRVFLK